MIVRTVLTAGLAAAMLTACSDKEETSIAQAEQSAKADVTEGATEVQHLGNIEVSKGWARETSEGAANGGGFLTITNGSSNGDKLLGAKADFAEKVELHETKMADGVMKMRPITDGIPVPAGATLEFKPGGLHLMFIGLKRPLKAGETIPVTLEFGQAGEQVAELEVRSMADMMDAETTKSDMDIMKQDGAKAPQ